MSNQHETKYIIVETLRARNRAHRMHQYCESEPLVIADKLQHYDRTAEKDAIAACKEQKRPLLVVMMRIDDHTTLWVRETIGRFCEVAPVCVVIVDNKLDYPIHRILESRDVPVVKLSYIDGRAKLASRTDVARQFADACEEAKTSYHNHLILTNTSTDESGGNSCYIQ